jgi:hypothetical protein
MKEIKAGGFSPASLINYYLQPSERLEGGTKTHADFMCPVRMREILEDCINKLSKFNNPASKNAISLAKDYLKKK